MGWRNLEIDHLIIGELIAHRYDVRDDQLNAAASGVSDTETPADTDVSGHPRDHEAAPHGEVNAPEESPTTAARRLQPQVPPRRTQRYQPTANAPPRE